MAKKHASSHKKPSHSVKKRAQQNIGYSKTLIYISAGVIVLFLITYATAGFSKTPAYLLQSDSKAYVLGDDDKAEEEAKEVAEKAQEQEQKEAERDRERKEEERETSNSGGSSAKTESMKMVIQEENGKRETEIETIAGQKIKTKVEDDGSAKIEIEQKNLKIKYELRNGQIIAKAEDEDGTEVELDDDQLTDLEEELEDDGIKIATGPGNLTFAKNQIAATTNFPLSIDVGTNELVVTTPAGQKRVTVLPDEAIEHLLATGIISEFNNATSSAALRQLNATSRIRFTIRNGDPVYEIEGRKTYRLFALIPVSQPVTAIVSSETGAVVATDKPFLTNVIDFLSP